MQIKITAGINRGRKISVPKTALRPTEEKVRSAVFDTLFSLMDFEEKVFLDVFAGSGAVGFEALSRGFKTALFVEMNRRNCETIKSNSRLLDEENEIDVVQYDAFSENFSKKLGVFCNAVFIDPPYEIAYKSELIIETLLKFNKINREKSVIVVESGKEFMYTPKGFERKDKKYGNTFLTFFY